MLQRRLRIGYLKACALVEALATEGVVGPREDGESRRVIQAVAAAPAFAGTDTLGDPFADVDNDGITDVIFRKPSGKLAYLKRGSSPGVSLPSSPLPVSDRPALQISPSRG